MPAYSGQPCHVGSLHCMMGLVVWWSPAPISTCSGQHHHLWAPVPAKSQDSWLVGAASGCSGDWPGTSWSLWGGRPAGGRGAGKYWLASMRILLEEHRALATALRHGTGAVLSRSPGTKAEIPARPPRSHLPGSHGATRGFPSPCHALPGLLV